MEIIMKMNQRQKQNKLFIFNAHVHQAILKIVEPQLPLDISARDLDDQKLWEILCHASVKQSFIETSCCALTDAPSGNTAILERQRRVMFIGPVAK
jgi:hypothetical protein